MLLWALPAMCSGVEPQWVRPCDSETTAPRWGHRHGLQVGLPGRHPRGLLYLYLKPVVQSEHVLNFIAIEPVVNGSRAYSELEPSQLDGQNGKRFWSVDEPTLQPSDPDSLACGTVQSHGTTESLRVYVVSEPFANGAHVYLRLTFRSDRPYELELETYAAPGSAPMSHCILTATMGNYARLRKLHLENQTVTSRELWPDYRNADFAPAKDFGLDQLPRTSSGAVRVWASPDEADPASSQAPGHWNYSGVPALQYWSLAPEEVHAETRVRLNGRYTYWMSKTPIPGGISFENFELERPFRNGERVTYGVTTDTLSM